jgi:hypothetical protein
MIILNDNTWFDNTRCKHGVIIYGDGREYGGSGGDGGGGRKPLARGGFREPYDGQQPPGG